MSSTLLRILTVISWLLKYRQNQVNFAVMAKLDGNIDSKSTQRWTNIYDRRFCAVHSLDITEIKPAKILIAENPNKNDVGSKVGRRETARNDRTDVGINIHRKHRRKLYDRSFHFMQWVEPEVSTLVDNVSDVPLSHITLLCKNMISATCSCLKCETYSLLSNTMCHRAGLKVPNKYQKVTPSGSCPEGCPIPPYWMKNFKTGEKILKQSDVDLMLSEHPVGFDRGDESSIIATIETMHTSPGYLRLRGVDGKYINSSDWFPMSCNLPPKYINQLALACLSEFERLSFTGSVDQHGPAMTSTGKQSLGFDDFHTDFVRHYPCASWPPQAESWLNRYRPSNFPARETVEK